MKTRILKIKTKKKTSRKKTDKHSHTVEHSCVLSLTRIAKMGNVSRIDRKYMGAMGLATFQHGAQVYSVARVRMCCGRYRYGQ